MTNDQPELEGDGPWREFSSRVQAAASDSGPVDLVAQYEQGTLRTVVEKFLDGPPEGDRSQELSPSIADQPHSSEGAAALLIYGVDDNQVPIEIGGPVRPALDQPG